MRRKMCLFLVLTLLFTSVPFDISFASSSGASSWAEESVNFLISHDVTPEYLRGDYQKPITRVEFSQLTVRTLDLIQKELGFNIYDGYSDVNYFINNDISNPLVLETNLTPIMYLPGGVGFSWEMSDKFVDTTDKYVYLLAKEKIVLGTGLHREEHVYPYIVSHRYFSPDALITREQSAIMILNSLEYLDNFKDGKFVASYKPVNFVDKSSISPWALPAVTMAVNNELIAGVGGNRFDPRGNLTREQTMVMLHRMYRIVLEDAEFMDRVLKANEGYVFFNGESEFCDEQMGWLLPRNLAERAINNSAPRRELKVEKPAEAKEEGFFIGDVSSMLGKKRSELSNYVGGIVEIYEVDVPVGGKSYYYPDANLTLVVDSSDIVCGVSFGVSEASKGYNIFGKITTDTTLEELRSDYDILLEGVSRADFRRIYRVYPSFPGYMVELGFTSDLSRQPKLSSVLVFKGDVERPLDRMGGASHTDFH